ncbi:exodeoxyribonuclease VII large subunit [Spiroplasma gladiatoris]|uniref:Exodeoxyribonuclease 7 large subunit n=1 Tax=Spiroplasma gladiatoris TaxID=2143 RepID=A0A4P7AH10_9MOLU|nr:exodeoxyribonuclease VII large subunit [Spiroplasma gladiatoris]QBQ07705.1 exodeoxyribonuclease VII large subunit [Spiroplasma gladiatoris]
MSIPVLKISELNKNIKYYLETNHAFKNVSVKGEVANLTYNKSGHIYFSLKDSDAKIDCAIWKSNAQKFIDLNPSEGDEIIALGSLSYYPPSGKITFTIVDVKLDGVGELAIIYKKRKEEIENLGWTLLENKKQIPTKPENIGIVTAPTGAAIEDLISTMKRRYPLVNIYLFPAMVQGEQAAKDIANKIRLANNFSIKLDVLIVGRGGGSYEDLWSFNEMEVLKEIYNSKIPIISAVGHEPDNTLADLVADKRASTPTGAGEIATPDRANLLKILENKRKEFSDIISYKLSLTKNNLSNQKEHLNNNIKNKFKQVKDILNNFHLGINKSMSTLIKISKNDIDQKQKSLRNSLENRLEFTKNDLKNLKEKILFLSPLKPLEKGFVILKQNEKVIFSVKSVKNNNDITAIFKDGELILNIK